MTLLTQVRTSETNHYNSLDTVYTRV